MKNASMTIKKIIRCDISLYYPNVSEGFIFRTNYSKMNIGSVINGKWGFNFLLIAQGNPHLIYYTTIIKKLLSTEDIKKENSVPLY